jgi:hypothetical protein
MNEFFCDFRFLIGKKKGDPMTKKLTTDILKSDKLGI